MYRVLIVDDEIPFLESLATFNWENYGCVCIGKATNGEEAFTVHQKFDYALLAIQTRACDYVIKTMNYQEQ